MTAMGGMTLMGGMTVMGVIVDSCDRHPGPRATYTTVIPDRAQREIRDLFLAG